MRMLMALMAVLAAGACGPSGEGMSPRETPVEVAPVPPAPSPVPTAPVELTGVLKEFNDTWEMLRAKEWTQAEVRNYKRTSAALADARWKLYGINCGVSYGLYEEAITDPRHNSLFDTRVTYYQRGEYLAGGQLADYFYREERTSDLVFYRVMGGGKDENGDWVDVYDLVDGDVPNDVPAPVWAHFRHLAVGMLALTALVDYTTHKVLATRMESRWPELMGDGAEWPCKEMKVTDEGRIEIVYRTTK